MTAQIANHLINECPEVGFRHLQLYTFQSEVFLAKKQSTLLSRAQGFLKQVFSE